MGNNLPKNIYINALLTSIVSGEGNNWGKFENQNNKKTNKNLRWFGKCKKIWEV